MPTTGFHSEWITIKDNRILVSCRASFPDDTERFIASVACEFLLHNASEDARVVSIFYDDKSCTHLVTVASTNKEDSAIDRALEKVLHGIYNNSNCQVSMELVSKGDEDSDHYNQMEHLSIGAGVAVDRWRHADQKYQEGVSVPG